MVKRENVTDERTAWIGNTFWNATHCGLFYRYKRVRDLTASVFRVEDSYTTMLL